MLTKTAFQALSEAYSERKQNNAEIAEALRFHQQIVQQSSIQARLRQLLAQAQQNDQIRSDAAAAAAKQRYIEDLRQKRAEMLSAALNAQQASLLPANGENQLKLLNNDENQAKSAISTRTAPVVPQNGQIPAFKTIYEIPTNNTSDISENAVLYTNNRKLLDNNMRKTQLYMNNTAETGNQGNEINPQKATNSAISLSDQLILAQIEQFKALRANLKGIAIQRQQLLEKLNSEQIRLDKTKHPFSCELIIEQLKVQYQQYNVQYQQIENEFQQVKTFLKNARSSSGISGQNSLYDENNAQIRAPVLQNAI